MSVCSCFSKVLLKYILLFILCICISCLGGQTTAFIFTYFVIISIIIKILFIIGKKDKWFNSTSTSIVKENLINTADDDIPVVVKVNSISRLYFLDNIKAFVTCIVVCSMTSCWM